MRRLALALLATTLPAAGQAQTAPPRTDPLAMTVAGRPRPELDPLGVRLGAFRLDGMAELRPGYDSNLLGQAGRAPESAYGGTAGALSLNSGWLQHAVGASATVAAQQYLRHRTLDWHDWSAGAQGRYDLGFGSSVEARYRHYREHLDVYSYDVQGAGIARPVPYTSDELQVTTTGRLNRYRLITGASYRSYRYDDLREAGGVTPLSRQSFNATTGTLGGSYEVAPGRHATASLRVQDISHLDSSARGRDSLTAEALLGVQYDFDGVWQGRAAFGWRRRDYQGATLRPLSGPAAELTLTWLPSGMTTVSLSLARTIEESIQPNAVSYTRSLGLLRVDHEWRRNVILFAEAGLDNRDYQVLHQGATDLRLGIGPHWMVNRRLTLSAGYTHMQRLWSSGRASEYGRHLVEMRLRAAL